jgi:hypothetical protein
MRQPSVNQSQPHGFAGIAEMVSVIDIQALRSRTEEGNHVPDRQAHSRLSVVGDQSKSQARSQSRSSASARAPASPGPVASKGPATATVPIMRDKGPMKKLVGIAALVGIVIVMANLSSSQSSSSQMDGPVDTGPPMVSTTDFPSGITSDGNTENVAVSQEAPSAASDAYTAENQAALRLGNSTDPASVFESKPFAGAGNVLESSQIRYCLAEDIRIQGAEKVLDKYDPTQIDKYNAMIDDYNLRCSNFRYRSGTLERIQAEVSARRSELAADGAARLK